MDPVDEHKLLDVWWKTSVVGVAILSENGTWIDCNPALCSFLGYSLAELQKRSFQDITHPDDLVADVAMAREVAAGHLDSYDVAKRYITKTGLVVWANIRVASIRDDSNKFVVFLSQVSPLVPVERAGAVYTPGKGGWRFLAKVKEYWQVIVFSLAAVAYLISQVIKEFR